MSTGPPSGSSWWASSCGCCPSLRSGSPRPAPGASGLTSTSPCSCPSWIGPVCGGWWTWSGSALGRRLRRWSSRGGSVADELAEQVLVFIADYIGDHGFGPTVREICDACDIGSTATAHRRLQLLAEEGR